MSSTSVSSNSAGNLTTQDDRELHNPTQQSTTCHGISDATSRLSPRDGHHSNMIDCGHQGLQNSPPPPGPHTHLHETDGTDVPPERLPTYGELKSQEGHRFGRWRGWIEKRARERIEERTIDREEAERQGRPFGTGWDLPQLNLSKNQSQLPPMNRNSSIISARDERAAFKSASRNHRDAFFKHQKGKFDGSTSSHRPNLEPGPGAVKLTPSTSIHQIGSRFLPQFASQPLCAIPLPLIKTRHHYPSTTEPPAERFLLVGTIDGLYVCDLMPSLSSTVKKDMVSPTDSKIYQLWQGLGVHQLEIAVEDTPHSTNTSVPGIVIALTSSSNESSTSPVGMDGVTKSIKMWPLQSMINLVKFRAFSESSECLDLHERPTNTKKTPSLTAGTSALAGFISMFEKGKHKAESSISTLSDTFSHTSTRPQSGGSYGHKPSPTSPFTKPSTLPASSTQKSSNQSHLDLPLQWAKQTISLNLPRIQAYGPILFIKLSNSPVPGFNPINDQLDQINDSQSIPSGLRPRSRARTDDGEDDSNALNDGWWYLIIATKQMIFVMESQPASQRTWHLCAEMSAPFTAKSAHLVLSEFPRSNHSRTASQSRASTLLSRRSHNPRLGYGELAVLLTMKEYAVVISLSDLSVRELDLQGTVTASQSTASISAYTSSLRPTTGSFSGLSNLERVQNNFKPFGRHTPPTTGSIEPVLINKRVKDGLGMARDEGFQVENRRLSRLVSDRRWAGCEELLIPVPSQSAHSENGPGLGGREIEKEDTHHPRAIYLVTRGYLTYAVICPFGYEFRRRSSQREPSGSGIEQRAGLAGGLPPPLLLKPVHTFTWRAMPVKLQAQIIPTPRKWAKLQEKKELPGGAQSDQNSSSDEVFCCLTAFTASSVEVQEGFISLKFLRIMWETARFGHRPDPKLSFFTPASCAYRRRVRQASSSSYSSTQTTSSINDDENDQTARQPTLSRGAAIPISPQPPSNEPASSADQPFESGEDELNDNSSYDYSAKIGYLCNSAAWFSRTPSSQAQKDLQPSQPIHHLDRNPDSFGSSTSNATISAHDHPPQHEAQQQQSQNSHLGGRDFTQGSFFWKQAVGEWKIMYVCNSMDL